MARYSDEILGRIRGSVDIIEWISQSVPLKKAGANYKGLCPFHEEKTPSFNVHPGKRIFYCFGCSRGGDIFKFTMKHANNAVVEKHDKDCGAKSEFALQSG